MGYVRSVTDGKMMTKKPSITKLTKKLDSVFSRFVRISHADSKGMVQCYTCPYKAHWKSIHAGHYVTRWYMKTRWDERNVRPQCFSCNIWKKGAAVIFRANLAKEIGESAVLDIERVALELKRGGLSSEFLAAKIEEYEAKIHTLPTPP